MSWNRGRPPRVPPPGDRSGPASHPSQSADRRRAFEAEALPHLGRVWSAARRLVPQDADAEDLVQEAYLRAYRGFDRYARGTNCRAWLLTILYSVFVNRYHRERREPEPLPLADLEERATRSLLQEDWEGPLVAAASAGAWGLGAEVEQALSALPEAYRDAVLLVDVEELTYEEAATAMSCPIGTVRSRLARARRLLAILLADYARARHVGRSGE